MRTWTKLAPAVLLALPFTLAPARAADPELPTPQQFEQMKKDLVQLRKDLDQLKAEMTTHGVRGARIEEQLNRILASLDSMARQQEAITRRSGYFGLPAEGGAAPATGTITVENQYPATATIRLNGRPYVIPPYRTIPISGVPLGNYQYEVEVDGYGVVQPLQTETLRGGRRITVFAR